MTTTAAVADLDGVPLAGLELGAPLGSGASGSVWAATTPSGQRVAVRALPQVAPERDAARARRLAALSRLEHPGLARVQPIFGADRRLLVTELIAGPTLATVRLGRLGLSADEALSVARSVAEAVIPLHASGLAHGDVSPANIVLRGAQDDAAPVLVDLLAEPGWEAGTAGFVAPEVRGGAVATAASDVWAIAATAIWAADLNDRDYVARTLRTAAADEPKARPSAAALVEMLASVAPTPVRVPPPSVLAGAAMREQAQRAQTVVRPGRRQRRAKHRQTSRGRRFALVAAIVLVVGLAGWGWSLRGASLWGEPSSANVPSGDPSASVPGDAPAADVVIARLTELVGARDAALVAADPAALAALTVPGAPAQQEDVALLGSLTAEGTTVGGLQTQVSDAIVLESAATMATVRAQLTQGNYERTTAGVTEVVAAQPQRCVEFDLVLVDEEWLVEAVSPCQS